MSNPDLRVKIVDLRRSYEQIIHDAGIDKLIEAGYSTERARQTVDDFRQFIEDNKDEITALQILYSHPYSQRLSFKRHSGPRERHRATAPPMDT